jgi:hypothetical protein
MATALPGGSVSGASMRSSQPFDRAELQLDSRRYQARAANDFLFAIRYLRFHSSLRRE